MRRIGRTLTAAISAIDIALHDLVSRSLGVPVYQLLGGRHRDFVPCFVTAWGNGQEMIDSAQSLIGQGWKVVRTGINHPDTGDDATLFEPRESIAMTAEFLVKLREQVGREVVLGIDYHHRLSVAEAASFCQMMPTGTLDFLEEPIRDECPDAYKVLRGMTPVPFAIGEEFASKW